MAREEIRRTEARRRGVLLAALTAVISGFAVFINGYGVRAWSEISDPTTYTTFKNVVAAGSLVIVASFVTRRRSSESVTLPHGAAQWSGFLAVAVVGGSVAFVLFFEGLARVSSTQAAFIHKTLVIWVAILAVGILRERIGFPHLAAVALLVWGQAVLIGGVGDLGFGTGEWMMLTATLLWSVEIIIAKRLLADVSSLTLGVARMAGGALLLIAYGFARGAFSDLAGVTPVHVGWILATGVVLAAFVGSWYAALARAQAVDVTAVLVAGALITALLRFGVQGTALPSGLGLGLVAAGVAIAVMAGWRRPALTRSR
jgi:drug/metabolite transporter (DMT)-like permease